MAKKSDTFSILYTSLFQAMVQWDANMYDGALFSFKGDFLDYLGLENMGVFTAHGAENNSDSKYNELKAFGESLV